MVELLSTSRQSLGTSKNQLPKSKVSSSNSGPNKKNLKNGVYSAKDGQIPCNIRGDPSIANSATSILVSEPLSPGGLSLPLSGDLSSTSGSSLPASAGSPSDSIDNHQQPSTSGTCAAAPDATHSSGAPPGDVRTGHVSDSVLASSVGSSSSPQLPQVTLRLRGGGLTSRSSSQHSGSRSVASARSSSVTSTPIAGVRSNPPRAAKSRGIASNIQIPSSPSSDADHSASSSSSSSESSAAGELDEIFRLAGTSRTTSSTLVEQSTVSRRVDGSLANTSLVRESSQLAHRGGGEHSSDEETGLFNTGSSSSRGRSAYILAQPWSCGKCGIVITQGRSIAPHIRECNPDIELSTEPSLCQYVTRCGTCRGVYARGTALANHRLTCNSSQVQARLQPFRQQAAALSQESRTRRTARQQQRHPQQQPRQQQQLLQQQQQQQQQVRQLPGQVHRVVAMRGVFKVPLKCQESLADVTKRFLDGFVESVQSGADVEEDFIAAFLALPDIFLEMKSGRERAAASALLLQFQAAATMADLCEQVLAASNRIRGRIAATPQRRPRRDLPTARLKYLLRHNCAGKATRLLEAYADKVQAADLSVEETRERTRALFPPAQARLDALPDADPVAALPHVSVESIQASFQSLPRQSANGMSSWTYDLIRQLGVDNTDLCRSMQAFLLEVFVKGKAGDPRLWTRSRGVVLQKPDGGLRPIAVGEAWTRFFARILASSFSGQLGSAFAPLQWGIGIPGGSEIAAHICSLFNAAMEEENEATVGRELLCIQQVDFENAFNSVGRRAIFDGLSEAAPGLTTYFRWSYGSASPVYTRDGDVLCESATGVRQGDPLGPLFFCAALQPLLLELQNAFPTCFFPTYMDDIHVLGPARLMPQVLRAIKVAAERIGLKLKEAKCARYTAHDPAAQGDLLAREGVVCLGAPIGTDAFVQDKVATLLGTFQRPFNLLTQLETPVAFPILQSCINTRPVYLSRTVAPQLVVPLLQGFDAAVDRILGSISGFSGAFPERSSIIRSLPSALGGCSLRRLAPIAHLAWSASLAHACSILATSAPSLVHFFTAERVPLSPVFRQLKEALPQFVSTVEETEDGQVLSFSQWSAADGAEDARVSPPKQRQLCEELDNKELETLYADMELEDPLGLAWLRSNSFKSSSRFLTLGENEKFSLPSAAVQSNLRLRLLLPGAASAPSGDGVDALVQCQICNQVELPVEDGEHRGRFDPRFHGLVCCRGQRLRTTRHNDVTWAMAGYLSRAFGKEKVSIAEPDLYLGNGARKADIRIQTNRGFVFVDISVVHPACTKYAERGEPTSSSTALAAADRMFKKKQEEGHAQFAGRGDGSPTVVYPVVFETTGSLCKASAEFLESTITGLGVRLNFKVGPPFDWLLRRCRAIICGANHSALTSFFQNSRVLRFGNPERRLGGSGDGVGVGVGVGVGAGAGAGGSASARGDGGGASDGAVRGGVSVGRALMSGLMGSSSSSSSSSSIVGLRRRSSSFPSSSVDDDVSANVHGSSSSTGNVSAGGQSSSVLQSSRDRVRQDSLEVDFLPGSDEDRLYQERSQRRK